MRAALIAASVIVAVLAIGWPQLSRSGYSPDEEFTVFAVRGISASGLPLLPSNWLYDRGLAYSYASWAAGLVAGSDLSTYRSLALISTIAALVLVFVVVRRLVSTTAATIALILVATSTPLWAAATTARFYAPFFALYVGVLLHLSTLGPPSLAPRSMASFGAASTLGTRSLGTLGTFGTFGTLGTLATLAFASRLTHELAFTLLMVPALCVVLARRGERATWATAGLAVIVGLALAQGLLFALHFLAPSSGDTMIERFFVWQVVNLFERPPNRQFGIAFVVLAAAWLIAPRRASLSLVATLCVVAFIVSLSVASEARVSPFSHVLLSSVLSEGSRYPLDMFWHIVRTTPVTITLALALLVARLCRAGGEWRPVERAAHLLWIGWVVWFGVIDSGITINYLLLPISLMLVAIAVDLSAILAHNIDATRRAGRTVSWAVCTLVIAALVSDQWRGEGSIAARLEVVRPTINVAGIDEIRDTLQPGDRVACTDELGCLMLVGRIDAWLALDDYVRERFVVRNNDGPPVGVYTGKPVVFRPADLLAGKPAARTLIVDVFKEYPVGHTRDWLPRALLRDGIQVTILLETPQARVVQIAPPLFNATRLTRSRPPS